MNYTLTIPDHFMEELHVQSGIYNPSELCREIFTIFHWVITETSAGKNIISENTEQEIRTRLLSPSIKNIQQRREKYQYAKQ